MARRKTTAAAAAATQATTALAPPRSSTTSPASTSSSSSPPAAAAAPRRDLVDKVYRWILEGHGEHDIREALAEKHPDDEPGALIVAAVHRFAEAGQFESEVLLGWCAEAYREIYRLARDAGDVAGALKAIRQLAQLAGFK